MTLESKAAFARRMKSHMGREVDRSTVTRWADAGRIVMDGDRVDVEASLSQLGGTQGDRQDVTDRHAQEAAEKSATGRNAPDTPPPTADLSMEKARRVRAVAEARIKAAEAEIREMERDRTAGKLIDKDVVDFVLNDFGATLRSTMENFAGRMAPVVFPLATLEETHAALNEAAEGVLEEISSAMKRRTQQQTEA